jgi:HlyD family secretion protein
VSLDAFEGTTFDGTVDSIATSPARTASSTVSYTVTVKLSGDTSKIYEGMTGDVTFISKQKKDVLYIPNRAVYMENNKQYVNNQGRKRQYYGD